MRNVVVLGGGYGGVTTIQALLGRIKLIGVLGSLGQKSGVLWLPKNHSG